MNDKAKGLAKLLASLARIVESLDDEKLDALFAGNFKLEIAGVSSVQTSATQRRSRPAASEVQIEIEPIVTRLRESPSSEDGRKLLKDLSKSQLRQIAKQVHIGQANKDDMETLTERILRQTIGQRISREAIRGTTAAVPAPVPIHPESARELPTRIDNEAAAEA